MGFLKNISKLVSAAVISQLIYLFLTPLLARYYTPSDFGLYSQITATAAIIASFATLKYEMHIPTLNAERIDSFLGTLIGVSILIVSSIAIAAFLFNLDGGFVFACASISITICIYQILIYRSINNDSFSRISIARITYFSGPPLFQIPLSGIGILGLYIGDIITKLLSIILMIDVKLFKGIRIALKDIRLMVDNWRYPAFMATASLLNSSAIQLPSLIILHRFGPEKAGLFALSRLLFQAPAFALSQPVGNVLYSIVSKDIKNGKKSKREIAKISIFSIIFATAVSLLLFLSIDEVTARLLPSSWLGTSDIIKTVFLFTLGQAAFSPFTQLMNLVGGAHIQFIWDAMRTTMLSLICIFAGDTLNSMLAYFSIVAFIFYLAIFIIFLYQYKRAMPHG